MVSRREFIQSVPVGALALATGGSAWAAPTGKPIPVEKVVALVGDGIPSRAIHYPGQLEAALQGDTDIGDAYLHEGAVGKLEARFAAMLGKEDAVFMPTGTMANQVALRILCGERRHLLLQKESHVYRDEEDATPVLSGINPVPLDGGTDEALVASAEAAFNQRGEDPYPVEIGAISIESPVRRLDGSCVDLSVIQRLSELARPNGTGMHLDGARLLLMSGQAGFDPRTYAAPFDTVYVSLYKYLGAPFGAILAGDKARMERARHVRHIFGGTLYHGWPAALPALRHLDGFTERFAKVRAAGEALLKRLDTVPGIRVERVPRASNIAILRLDDRVAAGLGERAHQADIALGGAQDGRLPIAFNETLLRRPVEAIAAVFPA
ncbi:low specificity L-threonine aldolase [Luteibacter sp. CQ10]|uniref:low specificity L-threonine aldolase n=1 Tax=Luteibacter sp. CQ10 TaxID=2805821 RepID=UPI0034A3A509